MFQSCPNNNSWVEPVLSHRLRALFKDTNTGTQPAVRLELVTLLLVTVVKLQTLTLNLDTCFLQVSVKFWQH